MAAVVGAVALGGCAGKRPADIHGYPAAAVPSMEARSMPVYRGGSGGTMSWAGLIEECASADAVIVGEDHGNTAGQAFEAALFADVVARAPSAGAALEFYERDDQPALDDYLGGLTTDAEFRKATGRRAGSDLAGHRAIIERCKAAGRPAIAANAPRRYVSLLRKEGVERLIGLSAEQRRLFRIPDALPGGRYRDAFFEMMVERAADATEEGGRVEAMFRAQSMWDWTMAESVARGIDGGVRPVVLIVGHFHIERGGGLVEALRALRPDARILTITLNPEVGVPPRSDDLDRADVVAPMPGE